MIDTFIDFLKPEHLIQVFGVIGVAAILFAESGTFLGFILPGDSLLISAGILASTGAINLPLLIVLGTIGAILGDQLGYWFGRKTGPALFTREDSLLFHKDNLLKAEIFYKKHGKKTIVLARYIAYVRMFAPMLAGAGKMEYRTFLTYNIIGGITWVVSLSLLGYTLGQVIPDIERYVLPIIISVIVISSIPVIYAGIKSYLKKKKVL